MLCEAYARVTGSDGSFPNTTFRRRTKEYMEGFTDTANSRQKTATYGTLSQQDWPQLKYVLPLMTILSIVDLHRENHHRITHSISNYGAFVQVDDLFQYSLIIMEERRMANHPSATEWRCIRDVQMLNCSLISFIRPETDALEDNERVVHEPAWDILMEMAEEEFSGSYLERFLSDFQGNQSEMHPIQTYYSAITDHLPDLSDYTPITMEEEFLPPLVDTGIVLGPGFDANGSEFDPHMNPQLPDYIIDNAHHLHIGDI
jgi:hypothetical protein